MVKTWGIQIVTVLFILNCLIVLPLVQFRFGRILQGSALNEPLYVFFGIGVAATFGAAFYLLLQAVLTGFYRPYKNLNDPEELPGCTVLIPAFNEGKNVLDSLESVVHSDYPAEKMEIIVIDDGSLDDTWTWIEQICAKYPDRIQKIRLPQNGGKKRALCRGILESSREIIVTVDSDSCLEPRALRNLLAPFPQDGRIGAVAGNVRVENPENNFLSRILDVAFIFGCDFLRSAQSVIGSVLCTPGAISAYRRSAVSPEVVQTWLNQSFLGAPSTIGEDRALASILLRNHWKIVCQNNAVVRTEVPRTYGKLCKMLLRWTRGDVRECLQLLGFVFSRWSLTDWRWICFQLNVVCQLCGIFLPFLFIPSLFLTLWLLREHWLFVLYQIISVNGLWNLLFAAVYMRHTCRKKAGWGILAGFYVALALSWICIYAVFTLKNSPWMTRDGRKVNPLSTSR